MEALQKLEVWRRACRMSADTYRLLGSCRERVLTDQLSRSALSVASNIAEGYGRESTRERIHFLRIAKASCSEAWTQYLIAIEAKLIDEDEARRLADEAVAISKMILGLIRHLGRQQNSENLGPRP